MLKTLNSKLNFGKHKGKTIKEVLEVEPTYLEWAAKTIPNFKFSEQDLNLILEACNKEKEERYREDWLDIYDFLD